MECAKIAEINKAKLLGYACIIDRSNKKVLINNKIVSLIKLEIKTFKENELPDELKKIVPIRPGSRNPFK